MDANSSVTSPSTCVYTTPEIEVDPLYGTRRTGNGGAHPDRARVRARPLENKQRRSIYYSNIIRRPLPPDLRRLGGEGERRGGGGVTSPHAARTPGPSG